MAGPVFKIIIVQFKMCIPAANLSNIIPPETKKKSYLQDLKTMKEKVMGD